MCEVSPMLRIACAGLFMTGLQLTAEAQKVLSGGVS